MATAALENSETINTETTERGAVVETADEAPHGGIFEGLKEDETQLEEVVEETPAEETEEKPDQETETVEETPVVEKADENPPGVTPSMRELALASGLPALLVDFCYDDAQMQKLMGFQRDAKDSQEEGEKDDTFTAKLMIPDEEFDATDPVHAQQKHMVDKFNGAMKQLRKEVGESADTARSLKAEREKDYKNSLFMAYDKALDTLDQDILGPSGSEQRKEAWPLFESLLANNPEKDPTQLAVQAARATHEKLVTTTAVKAQQKNLDKQKTKTLGGGASPAHVETPTVPMDEFKTWLRALPSDN